MQLSISKNTVTIPDFSIRRCGYGIKVDRHSGEKSYTRHFTRDLYPRFHLYIEDRGESWLINLHLDQRAPVYKGATAHAGDYDGPVVEAEIERIKKMLGIIG